ncbi:MAG: PEP-CTERM sorting domain-containing protein [bacterium]|nr:PEP-CTERM sorting domain-containing protein [bacterium]
MRRPSIVVLIVCGPWVLLRPEACKAETLVVEAWNTPTETSQALEVGRVYLLEVSGTYVLDSTNGRQADADWSEYWKHLGDMTWYENPADTDPTVTDPDRFDLTIDGAVVDWMGTTNGVDFAPHTYSPSHIYRCRIVGAGVPIEFQIADPNAGDNSGSLLVSIVPEPATLTLLALGGLYAVRRQR